MDSTHATGGQPRRRSRTRRIPAPTAGWLPQWYICDLLGCSPSWLYNQRRRGLIPAAAMLGNGRGARIARWWVEATRDSSGQAQG